MGIFLIAFAMVAVFSMAAICLRAEAQETPHLGRVFDLSETPMVNVLGPPDLPKSMDTMPFYHEGVWHLFHMQNGGALAHRTSRDLVRWRVERVALWSGGRGEADANIATGTVVRGHDGRFYYFYTGNQNVCLATSDDLYSWEKHKGNPVLVGDDVGASRLNFRDPFVFYNDEEACWWMLIGSQAPGRFYQRSGCVALAKSRDLLEWTLTAPLWAPGFGQQCDCPQVLQHGGHWYLFTLDRNAHYRVAKSLKGPWQRPPIRSWLPYPTFAMSRPATDGVRWITFPFMCNRAGDDDLGDIVQGRLYSVPRELAFRQDGALTEHVPREVVDAILAKPELEGEVLKDAEDVVGEWRILGNTLESPSSEAGLLRLGTLPADFYLEAWLELSTSNMDCSVLFRAAGDMSFAYVLDFRPGEKQLVLRPYKNWDNRAALATNYCEMPIGRRMKLRLFVFETAMEVFVDDKWSLSHSVYQRRGNDVFIEHRDGSMALSDIRIRALGGR